MSFLVDTDICSAYLRQVASVFNRFIQYSGRLHLSLMSLGELYTWAWRRNAPPSRFRSVQSLLNDVTLLELDHYVVHKFGEVQAYLLDNGQPMEAGDLLIAATALVHGLTLVTHNTRDFVNVPGLVVIDWLTP